MHSAPACVKTTHLFNAQKQLRENEIPEFVGVYCSGCRSNYFGVLAPLQPKKKKKSPKRLQENNLSLYYL